MLLKIKCNFKCSETHTPHCHKKFAIKRCIEYKTNYETKPKLMIFWS